MGTNLHHHPRRRSELRPCASVSYAAVLADRLRNPPKIKQLVEKEKLKLMQYAIEGASDKLY